MTAILDNLLVIGTLGAILVGLYAAYRFGGLKAAILGLAAVGLWVLYNRGRADGQSDIIEEERANADHAVREADQARVRAGVRDADPDKLRQSDGFRRD